jgi:hypothetical protein
VNISTVMGSGADLDFKSFAGATVVIGRTLVADEMFNNRAVYMGGVWRALRRTTNW